MRLKRFAAMLALAALCLMGINDPPVYAQNSPPLASPVKPQASKSAPAVAFVAADGSHAIQRDARAVEWQAPGDAPPMLKTEAQGIPPARATARDGWRFPPRRAPSERLHLASQPAGAAVTVAAMHARAPQDAPAESSPPRPTLGAGALALPQDITKACESALDELKALRVEVAGLKELRRLDAERDAAKDALLANVSEQRDFWKEAALARKDALGLGDKIDALQNKIDLVRLEQIGDLKADRDRLYVENKDLRKSRGRWFFAGLLTGAAAGLAH